MDSEPETGVPHGGGQTENITFPLASFAGGNIFPFKANQSFKFGIVFYFGAVYSGSVV